MFRRYIAFCDPTGRITPGLLMSRLNNMFLMDLRFQLTILLIKNRGGLSYWRSEESMSWMKASSLCLFNAFLRSCWISIWQFAQRIVVIYISVCRIGDLPISSRRCFLINDKRQLIVISDESLWSYWHCMEEFGTLVLLIVFVSLRHGKKQNAHFAFYNSRIILFNETPFVSPKQIWEKLFSSANT